jgi:hypothetical protein
VKYYVKYTLKAVFHIHGFAMEGGIGFMGILKWVAVVFAAGFVGYFGKYLSKLLIERFHRRKADGISTPQPIEAKTGEYDHKSEKKRLKLEKKKVKKVGDS